MLVKNKLFVFSIGLMVAVGLAALLVLGQRSVHSNHVGHNDLEATEPSTDTAPSETYAATSPAVVTVNVANFAFNPSTVNVPAGTVVRWNFNGGAHTTTSGNCCIGNGTWDSGILGAGETFEWTAAGVGAHPYFCQVHGAMMTGTINVTASTAVSVSGRVTGPGGRGLKGTKVGMTNEVGTPFTAFTNGRGFFSFVDIPTGHTYQIVPTNRRYSFTPQTVTVNNALTGIDFVGQGVGSLIKKPADVTTLTMHDHMED